jgi:ArsR family transcriptional regulator
MPLAARRHAPAAPDKPIQDSTAERIAALAKALGHPARVNIVRMLHGKQACIGCDIVEEIGLAQSTISEHLRILKAAGIIIGEIERPRICYSLNPKSLAPLAGLLNAILDQGAPSVSLGSICFPSPCEC